MKYIIVDLKTKESKEYTFNEVKEFFKPQIENYTNNDDYLSDYHYWKPVKCYDELIEYINYLSSDETAEQYKVELIFDDIDKKLFNILKNGKIENPEQAEIFIKAANAEARDDSCETTTPDDVINYLDVDMIFDGFCIASIYGKTIEDGDCEATVADANQEIRFYKCLNEDGMYSLGEDIINPFRDKEMGK